MIELRLLGPVEFDDKVGGDPGALLAQPKRLALLCYLALPKPGTIHRRDTLLGLFWPLVDSEHARTALRQGLAHVRRVLGNGVVLRRGSEEVGLDPTLIWCDVAAFEQALQANNWSDATKLYRGEFLHGLSVGSAPEFERWMEAERERLAARYAGALEQLADAETAAGHSQAAVECWRRLVDHDRYDSRCATGYMKALENAGDPVHALVHAREHREVLRQELGIAPSREFEALVERMHAKLALVKSSPSVPSQRGDSRPKSKRQLSGRRPPTLSRIGNLAIATAAAVVIIVVVGLFNMPTGLPHWIDRYSNLSTASDLDYDAVAVFPFRVGGADLSLSYLHEGVVDLLAAKLTGEGVPRALDPRSIVNAWNGLVRDGAREPQLDAALGLAARLNAGQAIIGSVVGTTQHMTIAASLLEVESGEAKARAEVTGPADSVSQLTDLLAVRLLAGRIESSDLAFESLSAVPLRAVRAYIAGKAASRRGSYEDAVAEFRFAVRVDSNFALAWLAMLDVAIWSSVPGLVDQSRSQAWRLRDRLSERDRAVLLAFVGPDYPQAPPTSADHLVGWEHALVLAPERPESWFNLGDFPLFHHGPLLGLTDSRERATAAFERAVDLDSGYVAPIEHLLELAILNGDTATARDLGARYLALDSTAALSDFINWHLASALGDRRRLDSLRGNFDQFSTKSLQRIIGTAQLLGAELGDARSAASELRTRAATSGERQETMQILHDFALNIGRHGDAHDALQRADLPHREQLRRRLEDLLYWNPQAGAGREVADQLSDYINESQGSDAEARAMRFQDLCALEQWRLSQNDTTNTAKTISTLRNAGYPEDIPWVAVQARWCAKLLEAVLAVRVRKTGELAALSALDSLNLRGSWILPQGNLVLAQLWAVSGNLDSALATVRRRPYHWREVQYLSSYLHEEVQSALALERMDIAERALAHYLALRSDPDPSIAPEVDAVRYELARVRGRN